MRNSRVLSAIGLAALLACQAAHAQSSVTVYGVVDAFVEFGKAGTKDDSVSITKLQSGGANSSRVGFRGVEDLGGGLKANFVLEHGFLADSGSPASTANFFNRQAFVGLSGDWGSLSAGRQYTPLLTIQDTFDTALSTTGYGSPYNSGVIRTISRVNNSVLYNTPKLGAFTASALIGFGETGGARGNMQSASIKYDGGGAFAAGLAYLRVNKADSSKSDKSIWNLSGRYKLADLTLVAGVQGTRNDSQNAGVQDDRQEFYLGAAYAIGSGEIRTAYGQGKVKNVGDSTARHASVAYIHNLSKRTSLFAIVQAIDNPNNLAYRSTGFTFDAIEGGIPAGAGVTAKALGIGIRHRF